MSGSSRVPAAQRGQAISSRPTRLRDRIGTLGARTPRTTQCNPLPTRIDSSHSLCDLGQWELPAAAPRPAVHCASSMLQHCVLIKSLPCVQDPAVMAASLNGTHGGRDARAARVQELGAQLRQHPEADRGGQVAAAVRVSQGAGALHTGAEIFAHPLHWCSHSTSVRWSAHQTHVRSTHDLNLPTVSAMCMLKTSNQLAPSFWEQAIWFLEAMYRLSRRHEQELPLHY